MKKKEEIYVRINTSKKARKVIKVLELFKEKIYDGTLQRFQQSAGLECFPTLLFANDMWRGGTCMSFSGREEVSIKELRNILAVEHLKEGDVVVCRNKKSDTHIFEIENKFGNSVTYEKRYSFVDSKTAEAVGSWTLDYFIRYATEEEKALLEDKPKELTKSEVEKKVIEYAVSVNWEYESLNNYIGNRISQEEYDILDGKYTDDKVKFIIEKFKPKLEVGKWYKAYLSNKGGYLLAVFNGYNNTSYGIHPDNGGEWFHCHNWFSDFNVSRLEYKEATKEEVEQALIKEAKKRYKVGDKVLSLRSGSHEMKISAYNFDFYASECDLWIHCEDSRNAKIFYNGKWAEIVEPSFVESADKIKVAGKNIGKRVRVIDGGHGAKGCDGKAGIIVDRSSVDFSAYGGACSTDRAECYIMTDEGYYWGLCEGYEIEYLTDSSALAVTIEIKDIATLQVIQKTLKELEEKLTKLI